MEASCILLTHFSQRYPKIPAIFEDNDQTMTHNHNSIGVAFDLMTVNFANFEVLPKLLPSLRSLFPEQMEDEDEGEEKEQELDEKKKQKQKQDNSKLLKNPNKRQKQQME